MNLDAMIWQLPDTDKRDEGEKKFVINDMTVLGFGSKVKRMYYGTQRPD